MPWWMGLIGLVGSLVQGNQAAQAQQAAIDAAKFSDADIAEMRRSGTSNLKSSLAERGLLDSSLLSGGLVRLEDELASLKKRGSGALSNIYQSIASRPSLLTSLLPLLLQSGIKGPSGAWWLEPYKPAPVYPWNPAGGGTTYQKF